MTIEGIRALKNKRKITMLTAYDYSTAELLDKAGLDIVLVGDSLANVVLGLESTTQVDIEQMLHHAKAVRRGIKNALLVGDMPYSSYQIKPEEGPTNALRFVKEAGVEAVKIEWFDRAPELIKAVIATGIPVMGHIGLTPQTADKLGGFKVQGKDAEAAKRLLEQAIRIQGLGCFSVILECVPDKVASLISAKLDIPTIGIGAGSGCDGQVLVTNDMLGLFTRYQPKFVKKFADLSPLIFEAFLNYKKEVEAGSFPGPENSFSIKEEEFKKLDF